MGGYVEGGINAQLILNEIFQRGAQTLSAAQQLGMGPRAYTQLMDNQAEWVQQRDSGGTFPKQSPLLQRQLENQSLQDKLKQDPVQFADLMKRQSNWEGQVERGEQFVKTSPVAAATFAALPQTAAKLDFTQKSEM